VYSFKISKLSTILSACLPASQLPDSQSTISRGVRSYVFGFGQADICVEEATKVSEVLLATDSV